MTGYVYLMRCNRHYKIGVAKDVMKRLVAIQIGNPYNVTIVQHKEFDNPVSVEKELHRKYSERNVGGEWFALRRDEVDWVIEYLGGPPAPRAVEPTIAPAVDFLPSHGDEMPATQKAEGRKYPPVYVHPSLQLIGIDKVYPKPCTGQDALRSLMVGIYSVLPQTRNAGTLELVPVNNSDSQFGVFGNRSDFLSITNFFRPLCRAGFKVEAFEQPEDKLLVTVTAPQPIDSYFPDDSKQPAQQEQP
jgi:hypothetical protein